ncbi:hypothetical protein V1293_000926 [Bradyrhizobium sp. AZCC 1693]
MPLVIQAISIAMWSNRRLAVTEVVVSECKSARSDLQSASKVASALHLTRL